MAEKFRLGFASLPKPKVECLAVTFEGEVGLDMGGGRYDLEGDIRLRSCIEATIGESTSTMRSQLRSLVCDLDPVDAQELAHRSDVLSWLDSGADIFRRAKPATPPEHLVSYCVLVDLDQRSALLVDRRDAGLWLPSGGHVDGDEDPALAAIRELYEELGVRPDFVDGIGPRPLFITRTVTEGWSTAHTDVSLWYVFDGSIDAHLEADEREFAAVKWWPFDQIQHGPDSRFDPHLPRFISKLNGVLAA